MRSDSNKRRGWREGERERSKEKEGEGEGGRGEAQNCLDRQRQDGKKTGVEEASVHYKNYSYFLL